MTHVIILNFCAEFNESTGLCAHGEAVNVRFTRFRRHFPLKDSSVRGNDPRLLTADCCSLYTRLGCLKSFRSAKGTMQFFH